MKHSVHWDILALTLLFIDDVTHGFFMLNQLAAQSTFLCNSACWFKATRIKLFNNNFAWQCMIFTSTRSDIFRSYCLFVYLDTSEHCHSAWHSLDIAYLESAQYCPIMVSLPLNTFVLQTFEVCQMYWPINEYIYNTKLQRCLEPIYLFSHLA